MPIAITFGTPINELNSWSFTADLTKDDGSALGPTALETLTLTLYDVVTNAIINAVDHVDIKNTGRGVLDAAGHLIVSLESADNPILTAANPKEKHKALLIGTWNGGKGYTSQEILFTVVNLNKVP
jgi:hypothetical protein